jgi:hypothetical protein
MIQGGNTPVKQKGRAGGAAQGNNTSKDKGRTASKSRGRKAPQAQYDIIGGPQAAIA